MNSIFLCGFNGFGQCDGLAALLKQLPYFETETDVLINKQKTVSNGIYAAEVKHNKRCIVNVHAERDSLLKQGKQSEEFIEVTGENKEFDNGVNVAEGVSDITASDHERNSYVLKCVGRYKEKVINIHNVGFSWARSALTFSSDLDGGLLHTIIGGYGGSQMLQLHLVNTVLLASTTGDILLSSNGNNLLLAEEDSEVLSTKITTRELKSSEENNEVLLGPICGAAHSFVACYDGISVGVLSSSKKVCDTTDGIHTKVHLTVTPVDSGLSIQHVSCGFEHTLLLSQHGGVYTFGCGSRGQLGHGVLESEEQPRMVETFEGLRCTSVAAGGWHSAAISECGDMYVWGWNESGQLGLPSPAIQQHNKTIQKRQEVHEESYTQQPRQASSLHLWPECVDVGLNSVTLVEVACGTRHTAVLSGCGKVFTAGWNKYRQLGHCHTNSMDEFLPVHFTNTDSKVQRVWCGAWNTAFLINDVGP